MIKMDKIKDKLTNIKLELLFIIVLLALVIIAGIAIFSSATKSKQIDNFKDDAQSLLSVGKNVYTNLEKTGNTNYIYSSEDGTSKAVCITINGLEENDYLTKDYSDWDGYIIIEKQSENYIATLWATNKKYVLNGYNFEEIPELSANKEITKYQDENFTGKVKTSFNSKDNKYNAPCINEKVE